MTKYRFIEEPCEVKVSSTVLKTSGYREVLAEFNADSSKDMSFKAIVGAIANLEAASFL